MNKSISIFNLMPFEIKSFCFFKVLFMFKGRENHLKYSDEINLFKEIKRKNYRGRN